MDRIKKVLVHWNIHDFSVTKRYREETVRGNKEKTLLRNEYDRIWQGAVFMHVSYMQTYGPYAVDSLWAILNYGMAQKAIKCIKERKTIDMSCVHVVHDGKTATNRIYHDSGGNRYFKPDSWDGGVYQDFRLTEIDKNKLKETDIVFINYSSTNFREVFELKSEYGYHLAVDFDVSRDFEKLEDIINQIDYIFSSGDEQTLAV